MQHSNANSDFFFALHIYVKFFIQSLTTLQLRSNNIGNEGAQYLGDALRHNTVGLVYCACSAQIRVRFLVQTLAVLHLGYNKIKDEGARYLVNAIQDNTVRLIHFSFMI